MEETIDVHYVTFEPDPMAPLPPPPPYVTPAGAANAPDFWQAPKAKGKSRTATAIIVGVGVLLGGFQIFAFVFKPKFEVGKCYSGAATSAARFSPRSRPCVASADPSRIVIRVTRMEKELRGGNVPLFGLEPMLAASQCLTTEELATEMSKGFSGAKPLPGIPEHGALQDRANHKVICYEVVKP